MTAVLSPTGRTTITRHRERGATDREELFAVLEEALVCHVGIVRDRAPVVLPSIFGVDRDGPDDGGTLYLHGSVAAPWLRESPGATVCATFTLVDALVLARVAFSHSMNYRSAVVMGPARIVEDVAERDHALRLIVDQVVPGRSATLRDNTRKELAATVVIAVPLAEASVKARTGGVADDPSDVAAGGWSGVVPLRLAAGPIETDAAEPVPDAVRRRVAGWGAPSGPR